MKETLLQNKHTPIEDLIKRLNIKADCIQMGEKIKWGSDSEIMREAATTLQSQANQYEREKDSALHLAQCAKHTMVKEMLEMKGVYSAHDALEKVRAIAQKYGVDLSE